MKKGRKAVYGGIGTNTAGRQERQVSLSDRPDRLGDGRPDTRFARRKKIFCAILGRETASSCRAEAQSKADPSGTEGEAVLWPRRRVTSSGENPEFRTNADPEVVDYILTLAS